MTPARSFTDWLEDRTGYRRWVTEALYESIPGGARWRYVWGSALVVVFLTQVITGVFLWMAYSPSANTAWESVYYINYQMQFGWLLRGIHHFSSQAMIVLLALHLLQVVVDGAYRAPREVNFWLGLVLMLLVLGLSLTGYLLPWDQKGYWATRVATNLMLLIPWVGDELQQLVVGGPDYGHHTLTRFFALHAGVLPGLLIAFLVIHLALFRRHGLCARNPDRAPTTTFWPDQMLKDTVASLAVLAFVLGITVWRGGADLGAPADPASPYAAPRPEWYFLFLFQFLKYFTGSTEVIGAIVLPGVILLVLALMPLVGKWKLGHRFNVAFVVIILAGAVLLTIQALRDDYYARLYPMSESEQAQSSERQEAQRRQYDASRAYLQAVHEAEQEADRVVELAQSPRGIPVSGALSLLRSDPKMQGPKLFRQHCQSCHNYVDPNNPGAESNIVQPNPTASNLYGFASREWITGLLDPDQINSPAYFGGTKFAGGEMAEAITGLYEAYGEEAEEELKGEFAQVAAALSAQAGLPLQKEADQRDAEVIENGESLIKEMLGCADCHKFEDAKGGGLAPDLTGYGSRQWLIDFISNPAQPRFYDERNDRMPAFHAHPDEPALNLLDEKSLGLLADWMRRDWYRPESPPEEAAVAAASTPGEDTSTSESGDASQSAIDAKAGASEAGESEEEAEPSHADAAP
ncbi:MAG: cytochrome bc complex cytochrome b subunit [Pirellulales bacterium]